MVPAAEEFTRARPLSTLRMLQWRNLALVIRFVSLHHDRVWFYLLLDANCPAVTSHKSMTPLPHSLAIYHSSVLELEHGKGFLSLITSSGRLTIAKQAKSVIMSAGTCRRQGRLKFKYCNHAACPWIPQRDCFSLEKLLFCNLRLVGGLSHISSRSKTIHLWTENVYFFFSSYSTTDLARGSENTAKLQILFRAQLVFL